MKKLGEVKPREIVGSTVAKRFDFQYHRAAEAAIDLVTMRELNSVHCEIHDDFVLEFDNNGTAKYFFKQVKTEEPVGNPWTFEYLFGIYTPAGKRKKENADLISKAKASFGAKLMQHFIDFGESCSNVSIIANVSYHADLINFLKDIKESENIDSLNSRSRPYLDRLHEAYQLLFNEFKDLNFLYQCIKSFDTISTPAESLETSIRAFKIKLLTFSEEHPDIKINTPDISRIAKDIVELVRTKSSFMIKLEDIPIDDQELKKHKAISINEIIDRLPIMNETYNVLSLDENLNLNDMSRVERVLKICKIRDDIIPKLCHLKSKWEAWLKVNLLKEDFAGDVDFSLLKTDCLDIISTQKTLHDWKNSSQQILSKYPKYFSELKEGDAIDLIIGFMLHLIATSKNITFNVQEEEEFELS